MWKIFMLIAISFALFCAYPIVAQSNSPPPTPSKASNPPQKQASSQNQKSQSDQRGAEQMPFVVKTIPTPKSQAETEQERKDHEEKSSRVRWTFILTGIVAAATALQAIFLYFGLKATKKAANAAQQSADAANISAKVAEKNLIYGKRAFVLVERIDGIRVPSEIGNGDTWRISSILNNTGDTPTQKMMMNINYDLFEKEIVDFPDPPEAPKHGFIGPKGTIHSCSVDIPGAMLEGERWAANGKVYVWGWIDYNDVFDETPRHRTEFCYEIWVQRILGECGPEKQFVSFRIHGKYNGADDECYRKPSPYVPPA